LVKITETIDQLRIQDLKNGFANQQIISAENILNFYRVNEPSILKATAAWRIHALIQSGVLTRISRGRYIIDNPVSYLPVPGKKVREISKFVSVNLPYVTYCIWESKWIAEFSHHIFKSQVIFLDAEKDVTESVYNKLRDKYKSVYDRSTFRNSSDLISGIVVRTLVSEAPIQTIQNVPTASLEKLLADVLTDPEFEFLHGIEAERIFENALSRYPVILSKMLRYADRKRKKDKVLEMIKRFDRYKDLLQNK
jgi:hypothetical protein